MTSSAAAFFRVEGTLTSRTAAWAAAWLALNSQHIGHRFTRLGAMALATPFRDLSPLSDPTMANRLAWMGLRGMSADRLAILGEEFAATYLVGSLFPRTLELMEQARRDGLRLVLVSDNIEPVVQSLANTLDVESLVCNRLELRNGRATGRLQDPVIGRIGGPWLGDFAARHGIDLQHSRAFGASHVDSTLLSHVGLPCAVSPDRALRQIARDLDWPIVEHP